MTKTDLIDEIPPYQAIDIMLQGNSIDKLPPPTRGYVVTFPDNGLDAVLLNCEEATPEKLIALKKLSKYPEHIFFRKAWLHTGQIIDGFLSERRYWSLR